MYNISFELLMEILIEKKKPIDLYRNEKSSGIYLCINDEISKRDL
jgi:hypothetical protein